MAAQSALILDFDGAVLPLPGSKRIALGEWQESVRFGCSSATLARLETALGAQADIPPAMTDVSGGHPTVFLGSGDYHHVSHLLIQHYRNRVHDLQVVVFDNHPDNMRYPFGIHCGSWVWHVSRLPFVRCVHVVGITSADVQWPHAWENHLRPLRTGKVRYWCVGRDLGWMTGLGIAGSRAFASMASMLDAFNTHLQATAGPLYVSIDKDVLAPDAVRTNWDQGVMRVDELTGAIRSLQPRIVGSDVTGEVSLYRYRSWFKRLLSGLDGQPAITAAHLQQWQLQHQAVNRELLGCLKKLNKIQ
jgi:hypothetical protein